MDDRQILFKIVEYFVMNCANINVCNVNKIILLYVCWILSSFFPINFLIVHHL